MGWGCFGDHSTPDGLTALTIFCALDEFEEIHVAGAPSCLLTATHAKYAPSRLSVIVDFDDRGCTDATESAAPVVTTPLLGLFLSLVFLRVFSHEE